MALSVALLTSQANAGITFDYSNDGGFFASHLVAKAALEKAAADINSVINYNLGSVNDKAIGTSGGKTVTVVAVVAVLATVRARRKKGSFALAN